MSKIKVEVTALQNNAQTLEQYIVQLEALNAKLDTLIAGIESSWEGDASKAYINTMRRYSSQAATMVKAFYEFQSYVKNAAVTFENTDKKAASRITGSF